MSSPAPLAVVFGGSGFVGRYVTRRLAQAGWRVRVGVRRPNEAGFVRAYGAVGQVEPMFCNIRDDASVAAMLAGSDAAITCVGTFDKSGKNNFDAIHNEAAGRIARLAAAAGTKRLVHLSALGADAGSTSLYLSSKARGETSVVEAFPEAVILRPSVIFGNEDGLFNRLASMARLTPIVPVVGARTRMQPVYVDDVAAVAVAGANGTAAPGIYELGGPDIETMQQLTRRMLDETRLRRAALPVPFAIAGILGGALDFGSALTGRLLDNKILTRDQVRQLEIDSVTSGTYSGLADLGIEPTAMGAVLPGYLWRFRSAGQFEAIQDSAKRLRKS